MVDSSLHAYICASITHHQNEWLVSEDFSVAESMLTRAPHKKMTPRAFVRAKDFTVSARDDRIAISTD